MARTALDTGSLGHIKSAIEKVKAANQAYSTRVGLGVEVCDIEVRHLDGIIETLSPRDTLYTLQNDLYVK